MGGRLLAVASLASACVSWASSADAQSYGYHHLPSTQLQFCGLGYGPGHHAPMIRAHGCAAPHTARRVHMHGCPNCIAPPLEWFCTTHHAGRTSSSHSQLDQLIGPTLQSPPEVEAIETPVDAPRVFNFAPDDDESVLPTEDEPAPEKLPLPQSNK